MRSQNCRRLRSGLLRCCRRRRCGSCWRRRWRRRRRRGGFRHGAEFQGCHGGLQTALRCSWRFQNVRFGWRLGSKGGASTAQSRHSCSLTCSLRTLCCQENTVFERHWAGGWCFRLWMILLFCLLQGSVGWGNFWCFHLELCSNSLFPRLCFWLKSREFAILMLLGYKFIFYLLVS